MKQRNKQTKKEKPEKQSKSKTTTTTATKNIKKECLKISVPKESSIKCRLVA